MSSDESIIVHKGKGLKCSKDSKDSNKIFVFDLDETIGSFSELYNMYKTLEFLKQNENKEIYKNDEEIIFALLDIFPEFFRYGISILFKYLYEKKKAKNVNIYIYTNNKCIPTSWTSIIVKYMESIWDVHNLIDNIICAFKINNIIIEYNRTSQKKIYKDFITCIQLKKETEICFIDNLNFPGMKHRHVYYLRPKPYYHYVNRSDIINRTINSQFGLQLQKILDCDEKSLYNKFISYYNENNLKLETYVKSKEEMELDILVSKKLLYHCKKFFNLSIKKCKSRKNKKEPKNKTQKIYFSS